LNYIKSKTRSHNKIDKLSYTNDHGVETVVSNDLDKANAISNYLTLQLIFECSLRTNTLPEAWKLGNITPII